MRELTCIDDVIATLDEIIAEAEQKNDTLGYFAVLYQKVTVKVKEGILSGYYDDPERMELLDVIFAKRYIDAYYDYRNSRNVTKSWDAAFVLSKEYWAVVMQHLLIGMNAHINLDLGIAAAEVSKNKNIQELKGDFYRINQVLASLVDEVQQNLSTIWPPLKFILLKTGQYDNLLVDFSMKRARDGAWRFAEHLALLADNELEGCITDRDNVIAKKALLVTKQKMPLRLLLRIIRLGETGSVAQKINQLKLTPEV